MATTQLRKITIKSVLGSKFEPEDVNLKEKRSVKLLRVYGVIAKTRAEASDLGPFVRFLGEFEAVNLLTGEMFSAPACILPKFLEDQLAPACEPDKMPVTFAVEIGAVYNKDVPTKFMYTAQPLVETVSSAPMKQLKEQLSKLALPSPREKAKAA
jgi:hypothetical protein